MTYAVSLSMAAAVGYFVAVLQRATNKSRIDRYQRQRLQRILQQADALCREICARGRGDDQDDLQGRIDCRTMNEFEATLLQQIQRIVSYEKTLLGKLNSTRDLLDRRSHQLALSHNEARRDTLSSLLNRRGFDEMFDVFLDERKSMEIPFGLFLIDVDHFKRINDLHGHLAGDQALTWVGKRLAETVRPTDCVARFGGDEFAVMLRGVELDTAEIVAQRLLTQFRDRPFELPEGQGAVKVTLSIGIALAEANDTIESLLNRADMALYDSKKAGRNRYSFEGWDGDERADVIPMTSHASPA